MNDNSLRELVEDCEAVAFIATGESVPPRAIRDFLQSILFGTRDLWHGFQTGLLTSAEASNAIADRYWSWLLERADRPFAAPEDMTPWHAFIARTKALLERG
jgi:hypothetical protein